MGRRLIMDRTNLDDAVARRWTARRPRHGGVEIRHVDEEVAAELLLRVRVRPVEDLGLAVRGPHRRGARGRAEAVTATKHLGLGEGLAVGSVGGEALLLLRVGELRPA